MLHSFVLSFILSSIFFVSSMENVLMGSKNIKKKNYIVSTALHCVILKNSSKYTIHAHTMVPIVSDSAMMTRWETADTKCLQKLLNLTYISVAQYTIWYSFVKNTQWIKLSRNVNHLQCVNINQTRISTSYVHTHRRIVFDSSWYYFKANTQTFNMWE